MTPDDKRHGRAAGYWAGCRRDCCRAAIADYMRHLRTRQYLAGGSLRINATGTKRRLRALVAMGWTLPQIDVELGRGRSYSANLLCGPDTLLRSTAHRVADVYERLSMRLPENDPDARPQSISRAKNYARRNGWPPPLAWDEESIDDPNAVPQTTDTTETVDPVVVERILAGDWRLAANPGERREVIARWPGALNELERLCGWNVARLRRYHEQRESA